MAAEGIADKYYMLKVPGADVGVEGLNQVIQDMLPLLIVNR